MCRTLYCKREAAVVPVGLAFHGERFFPVAFPLCLVCAKDYKADAFHRRADIWGLLARELASVGLRDVRRGDIALAWLALDDLEPGNIDTARQRLLAP